MVKALEKPGFFARLPHAVSQKSYRLAGFCTFIYQLFHKIVRFLHSRRQLFFLLMGG